MTLGDRVVVKSHDLTNCSGIPFRDLTGTLIARARSAVVSDLWLVLFDQDVCGLSVPQGCDHDFNRRLAEEAHLYTIVEGVPAQRRRNQRFFAGAILEPLGSMPVPRNNDGRSACFWCGMPTKRVAGIANNYDICTRCGR